jgi:hypothetical protein
MPSDYKNSFHWMVYGHTQENRKLVVIVVCLFLLGHRDLDIGILLTSLTLPHFCACPKP